MKRYINNKLEISSNNSDEKISDRESFDVETNLALLIGQVD